jgi:predicted amidophosphoribosyltransferase
MLSDLFDALFPSCCAVCGGAGAGLCASCLDELPPACVGPPPWPVAWWNACVSYDGIAREVIARAKYHDQVRLLHAFVPSLERAIERAPALIDVVTWVPASAARSRASGVDHAEVIARALCRARALPRRPLLQRVSGAPQTGRDARARRAGPDLRALRRVDDLRVLVVDDVATTGGSLAAAARALRGVGAKAVFAVTIARTPPPRAVRAGAAYTPGAWTSSSSANT